MPVCAGCAAAALEGQQGCVLRKHQEKLLRAGVQGRKVLLQGGDVQPYDVLSINVGITPAASSVPGAAQHSIPVKPIDK
jgi:NADH dehydrogenase FAD-containing subunit